MLIQQNGYVPTSWLGGVLKCAATAWKMFHINCPARLCLLTSHMGCAICILGFTWGVQVVFWGLALWTDGLMDLGLD